MCTMLASVTLQKGKGLSMHCDQSGVFIILSETNRLSDNFGRSLVVEVQVEVQVEASVIT